MQTLEAVIKNAAKQIMDVARAECRQEMLERLGASTNGVKNGKKRKASPPQLCPAPKCKNKAAPVFGMLCRDHKGTPKATVAKWREARRKAAEKARN